MAQRALERTVLLLGEESAGFETFAPALRRANFSVRRLTSAASALQLVFESHLDLIVVLLPVHGAERVLQAVRADGSASSRSGVVVVGSRDGEASNELELRRLANRFLPSTCDEDEFTGAAAELIDIAPRVPVRESTHLRLSFATDASRYLRVHNLSTSGMLLTISDPLPVGAVFGFALQLPGEFEPIRGQAEVVRQAGHGGPAAHHVGVRFRTIGGEGKQQLSRLVERELANDNERTRASAPPSGAAAPTSSPPVPASFGLDELEQTRQELSDLTALLDRQLERGLALRLGTADWYSTGADLGMESLQALAAILAALSEGRDGSPEATRRLADLMEVRRRLAESGRPEQDLASRIRILIDVRPALERLLEDFGEREGASLTTQSGSRPIGLTSRIVVEARRLVARRRSLADLRAHLERLQSPRYTLARAALRRQAESLEIEYGALAEQCGLPLAAAQLVDRKELRAAEGAARLQLVQLQRRLEAVHDKAFSRASRSLATRDRESDLLDAKLHQALSGCLTPGIEYLARTRAVYRHALEAVHADPKLLQRVERLRRQLEAARKPAGR